jgi:hypothetical protein
MHPCIKENIIIITTAVFFSRLEILFHSRIATYIYKWAIEGPTADSTS